MTRDDRSSLFGDDPSAAARLWFEMLPPSAHTQWLLHGSHSLLSDQLAAIKELLHRNEQAAAASRIKSEELKQQRTADPDNEQMDRLYDDRFWQAVYTDSAHSMSAVGMLAPFIESLFVAIFDGTRRWQVEDEGDVRRQRADDQYWNPQVFFDKDMPKTNLVRGIEQLAASSGLHPYLPGGYEKTLSALFAYRNNMLHNGFEWPAETIKKFTNRIASEKWPETWFTSANREGRPWLYYMSPEFCAHCVDLIDGVIEGTGRYLKDRGV